MKQILMNLAAAIGLVVLLLTGQRALAGSYETQYNALNRWTGNEWYQSWNDFMLENSSYVRNDSSPAQIGWVHDGGRIRLANTGRYSPTIAYNSLWMPLNTDSPLLPRQLDSQSMSFGTPLGRIGKWGFGVSVGAGYAGSTPYNDPSSIYGMALITTQYKFNPRDRVLLSLDYNGNRSFMPDVPLPSIEYAHITRRFTLIAGFPEIGIDWRPTPKLRLLVHYYIYDDGEAKASYALFPWMHLYSKFDASSWAFHVDRYHSDQRLFFTMSRIEAGIKLINFSRHATLTIGGGYAFNQAFSQGFDGRDESPVGQIANALYAHVSFNISF
jgi:hypothetical protein